MNNNNYQYEFYDGNELKENKKLLNKLKKIIKEYEYMKDKDDILDDLASDSIVCCMTLNGVIMGFSWIKPTHIFDEIAISWFVINKQKIKGLDGKCLLDKTLEFCKSKYYKRVKFYCNPDSWGRIKNKNKLLSKFGYKVDETEEYFDVSINLE